MKETANTKLTLIYYCQLLSMGFPTNQIFLDSIYMCVCVCVLWENLANIGLANPRIWTFLLDPSLFNTVLFSGIWVSEWTPAVKILWSF